MFEYDFSSWLSREEQPKILVSGFSDFFYYALDKQCEQMLQCISADQKDDLLVQHTKKASLSSLLDLFRTADSLCREHMPDVDTLDLHFKHFFELTTKQYSLLHVLANTSVERGSVYGCCRFLGMYVDPNIQDENGDTALHIAIKRDNFAVIDTILKEGQYKLNDFVLDVTLRNNSGLTVRDLLAPKLLKGDTRFQLADEVIQGLEPVQTERTRSMSL